MTPATAVVTAQQLHYSNTAAYYKPTGTFTTALIFPALDTVGQAYGLLVLIHFDDIIPISLLSTLAIYQFLTPCPR